MVTEFDWNDFMDRWNKVIFNSDTLSEKITERHKQAKWLGEAPATPNQIALTEERFGVLLPPSYRKFLEFSNGWGIFSHFIDDLLPVDEIDSFYPKHSDFVDAYVYAYLSVVGLENNTIKDAYNLICISGKGDNAFLLLNPNQIDKDGEWQAWFWAVWQDDGPHIYDSFWNMMHGQFFELTYLLMTDDEYSQDDL